MVEQLQEGIAAEINARLLGSTVEVLVEGEKQGKWWGRTRGDKLVFFEDEADHMGQLVEARIDRTGTWSLQGSLARARLRQDPPSVSPSPASRHQKALA